MLSTDYLGRPVIAGVLRREGAPVRAYSDDELRDVIKTLVGDLIRGGLHLTIPSGRFVVVTGENAPGGLAWALGGLEEPEVRLLAEDRADDILKALAACPGIGVFVVVLSADETHRAVLSYEVRQAPGILN